MTRVTPGNKPGEGPVPENVHERSVDHRFVLFKMREKCLQESRDLCPD